MDHPSSILRLIVEDAFNQGNFGVIDDALTVGSSDRGSLGGAAQGPNGLMRLIAMYRSAFADLHCTLEDDISAGDSCAARWTMSGAHSGVFMGVAPTGRLINVLGTLFAHTENGRITEGWILVDQLGILQQLGVVPPPKAAPSAPTGESRAPFAG